MQDHQEDSNKGNKEIRPIDRTANVMTSKSLRKVQRTEKLGQDRQIKLLDKQGREIRDQDTIIERIEEFYTELYDSISTLTQKRYRR